ncbi:MAG: GntR family transcriptional regulator [Lentisphaerae bacterium]|nr:GntR family transcriptional regulator [Lentisphaerota bacterium]
MTEKISKTAIVTEALAKSIRSGKYKPGEKLPSMRTLGEQFQVSTMVLYQACEKLEKMGMIHRSARSGLFIPIKKKQSELCAFISGISAGNLEGYYESFLKACSAANCIAMTLPLIPATIECMIEKQPVRIYIDAGGKELSLEEIKRLTTGYHLIFCNRFEWLEETPESAVLTDWTYITEETLRYFLKRGHKKILFVSHDPEIREYKRRQMEEAGKRVGLKFGTSEFNWCSYTDFHSRPDYVAHLFRDDPPTAVFARGDNPLYEFCERVRIFFPDVPKLDKVGAYNTVWSNQPGQEFLSWTWEWDLFWQQVFAHKSGIEYYRPKLTLKA